MKFVILPLLVAVNYLDNNDPAWQSGPEIIYNVTFNLKVIPFAEVTQFPNLLVTNLTSQLKCRYRAPDYLHCNLERSKVLYSFLNSGTEAHDEYTSLAFGIKFNELGIKKLIVPSTMNPHGLDKIRFLVNQLHAGINLVGKTEGSYRLFENFTTGYCLTDYYVELDDSMEHHRKDKTGKYKMWSPAMRTVIEKTRDMDICKIDAPYFYESREGSLEEPKFLIKMKSSKSKIIADHSTFISTTQTTVELFPLKNREKSGVIQMHENMTIIYDSVVPAKGELPEIENPTSVGIITGKWRYDDELHDNSDEVENKSENN